MINKDVMAKGIVIAAGLLICWKLCSHWLVPPKISLTQLLAGMDSVAVTEISDGFLLVPNSAGYPKPYIVEGVKQVYQGKVSYLPSSFHQVAATHEGAPPKDTRYEFSLAIKCDAVRNGNFAAQVVFDIDEGILYSPNYPGQWAVASPILRQQMKDLQGKDSIFDKEETQ